MKRRTMKQKTVRTNEKPVGKSKYAKKVRSGNQMYGPGCCAHGRVFAGTHVGG